MRVSGCSISRSSRTTQRENGALKSLSARSAVDNRATSNLSDMISNYRWFCSLEIYTAVKHIIWVLSFGRWWIHDYYACRNENLPWYGLNPVFSPVAPLSAAVLSERFNPAWASSSHRSAPWHANVPASLLPLFLCCFPCCLNSVSAG